MSKRAINKIYQSGQGDCKKKKKKFKKIMKYLSLDLENLNSQGFAKNKSLNNISSPCQD